MSSTGKLEETSLVNLLQLINLTRLTGGLLIKGESIATINFHRGELVYVGLEGYPIRLGDRMVDEGTISDEQLKEVLVHQQRNKPWQPVGSICVSKGFVSETELEEVLHRQMTAMARELFKWDRGLFKFEPGEVTVSDPISLSLFSLLGGIVDQGDVVVLRGDGDGDEGPLSVSPAAWQQEMIDIAGVDYDVQGFLECSLFVQDTLSRLQGSMSKKSFETCLKKVVGFAAAPMGFALKRRSEAWIDLEVGQKLEFLTYPNRPAQEWEIAGELLTNCLAVGSDLIALGTTEQDQVKLEQIKHLTEHLLTSFLAFAASRG